MKKVFTINKEWMSEDFPLIINLSLELRNLEQTCVEVAAISDFSRIFFKQYN